MKTAPKIGQRVLYYRPANGSIPPREISGTVEKIYPGYRLRDDDTGELIEYPPHAVVRVDSPPDWWSYTGTDRFAPSIEDLEPI